MVLGQMKRQVLPLGVPPATEGLNQAVAGDGDGGTILLKYYIANLLFEEKAPFWRGLRHQRKHAEQLLANHP